MKKYAYLERLFYEEDFENFKSNICHYLKSLGDREFLFMAISENWIPVFVKGDMLLKALYTLALTDYLEELHGLKPYPEYNEYRKLKLTETIYPRGVLILDAVSDDNEKEKTLMEVKNSRICRYFIKYNIVDDDIRNVV